MRVNSFFKNYKKSYLLGFLLTLSMLCFSAETAPLKSDSPAKSREAVLNRAKEFLGVPYVSGGISKKGVDCSGLIYSAVLDTLGQAIPRSVQAIANFSMTISRSDLEPGDILFFETGAKGKLTHVALYLGDEKFIHAASAGNKTGVIISSLTEKYYINTYSSCARLLPSAKTYVASTFATDTSVSTTSSKNKETTENTTLAKLDGGEKPVLTPAEPKPPKQEPIDMLKEKPNPDGKKPHEKNKPNEKADKPKPQPHEKPAPKQEAPKKKKPKGDELEEIRRKAKERFGSSFSYDDLEATYEDESAWEERAQKFY